MARANAIPEHVKVAIIRGLACFDSPSTVVLSIKTEYDYTVSPQAVEAHDPTKRAGAKLATKWRGLFESTRERFIADTAAIPIAHRSTRLRALWRMAEVAERKGNLVVAANLYKQAAEEMGNAYTNRVELTGKAGAPIATAAVDLSKLTEEQQRVIAGIALDD